MNQIIKHGNFAVFGSCVKSCRKWTAPAMPSNKLSGLSGMFWSFLTSSVSHCPNMAALYSHTSSPVTCASALCCLETGGIESAAHLVQVEECVSVPRDPVTEAGPLLDEAPLPDQLPPAPGGHQVLVRVSAPHLATAVSTRVCDGWVTHLVGRQHEVTHSRGSVTPVHQPVLVIA